jgi:hypothetical protein
MKSTSSPLKSMTMAIVFVGVSLLSLSGNATDSTITVNDKTLKLIGAGLREFLFIDIYRMSAYSESGDCNPSKIVYKNETKALRLKMLRGIPAERMRSTLRDTLDDNLPKDKDNTVLKQKIESFLARMDKDLDSGAYVELIYIPGQGTIAKRNGQRLGVTPGKDFADLLWKSYFGGNSCCSSLRSSILEKCRKQ